MLVARFGVQSFCVLLASIAQCRFSDEKNVPTVRRATVNWASALWCDDSSVLADEINLVHCLKSSQANPIWRTCGLRAF